MNASDFLQEYIKTALWVNELDDFSIDDISESELEEINKDCEKFQELIEDIEIEGDDVNLAHDFYLTRNHHGAGFWDGDYDEPCATRLTEISHEFGEQCFYKGDDGGIYVM